MRIVTTALAAAASAALVASALAQTAGQNTVDEIQRYRQALADGNPAELWEARGEELWKQPRGPGKVSLERCDLGKGPGVVKGAYVELPRYFADTKRVMDLEQRLVHCMVTLQGISEADAKRDPFAAPGRRSDMEALVAFITSESKGMKVVAPLRTPEEREMYKIGEKIFFYRAGTHDFACATCHAEPNKRIRLQDLPNLLESKDAQRAWTSWPAYRVSQGEVRSMQHRLWDCFRQQRFPEAQYASDAITALQVFLAARAEGGVFNAPSIKR
jgi:L-cysteine S-thiosulfotransferase